MMSAENEDLIEDMQDLNLNDSVGIDMISSGSVGKSGDNIVVKEDDNDDAPAEIPVGNIGSGDRVVFDSDDEQENGKEIDEDAIPQIVVDSDDEQQESSNQAKGSQSPFSLRKAMNNDNNDDEKKNQKFESDLQVMVCDPVKVGEGLNAYTNYTVRVITHRKELGGGSYVISRRYSDFKWLYDQLKRDFPLRIVPPVPGKALINRFSEQFVAVRCLELNRFMQAIASHSTLCVQSTVNSFLAMDNEAFALAKRDVDPTTGLIETSSTSAITGALGAFSQSVWSTISSVPSQIAKATTQAPAEIDPWFDERQERVKALRNAAAMAVAAARRRADETKADENGASRGALGDMARSLMEMARVEAQHDASSASTISKIAGSAEHECALLNDYATELREVMEFPMDYYTRYLDEVQTVLDRRLELLGICNAAKASLMTLQTGVDDDIDEAMVNNSYDQLKKARAQAELSEERFDDASTIVRDEIEQFFTQHAKVFVVMLKAYAAANMSLAMRLADSWKKLVVELNQDEGEQR